MSIQYGYLVVEGPHDVEFVGRFLKLRGCKRITKLSKLDPFWLPLVPTDFPHKDDLTTRMPVPTFFQSATHSIAVHSAIGDSKIPKIIEENLAITGWNKDDLVGLGMVLDADSEVFSETRFNKIKTGIQSLNFFTQLPTGPGEIALGQPHCGIFIMPDNSSAGTLEDLLLECAAQSYPSLLQCTHQFLSCVGPLVPQLKNKEGEDFQKPAGRNKVIIGSLANVLRPGKSVQVSIQDNAWVTADTVKKLPRLAQFDKFLQDLLSLSVSSE